ncbi:hypothetical protein [Variovorax sp. JS1663]|nr:hypothetical protein [Variovorax sp. JS1663]
MKGLNMMNAFGKLRGCDRVFNQMNRELNGSEELGDYVSPGRRVR